MSILLFLFSALVFDAGFVKTLLDGDEAAWQRLADETVPPEQDAETFAELANKLARFVSRSWLKDNVEYLEGKIVSVEKYDGKVPVYCVHCKSTIIFTPSMSQAWQPGDRIAAFGVYVKSYNETPVFVAPAIEWYPDTWLGNLGFDVGSFDQVPVSRVIDEEVKQNDDETNRRLFKFTESDREPFYGLLRAISTAPQRSLEDEAKKQPLSVIDLFNRPSETRGKPILLRGTAKRIIPTPVSDSDVQSLFGIDHYYQIYLFTEQSRGNPIVVCVRSLPEDMPVGDADDFAEPITVAAVPYKLWIYETSAGPHYAPIVVGREPVWHPKRPPPKSFTSFTYTVFFALVFVWFACRYWGKRRSHSSLFRAR